jgi:hypothetical protein
LCILRFVRFVVVHEISYSQFAFSRWRATATALHGLRGKRAFLRELRYSAKRWLKQIKPPVV